MRTPEPLHSSTHLGNPAHPDAPLRSTLRQPAPGEPPEIEKYLPDPSPIAGIASAPGWTLSLLAHLVALAMATSHAFAPPAPPSPPAISYQDPPQQPGLSVWFVRTARSNDRHSSGRIRGCHLTRPPRKAFVARPAVIPPDRPSTPQILSASTVGCIEDTFHPRAPTADLQTDSESDSESDDELRVALRWLQRHQHSDGHWPGSNRTSDPTSRATLPDVEPTDGAVSVTDPVSLSDVGATAFALLAFTGYRHSHRDGRHRDFRTVVDKGRKWLQAQQIKTDPEKRYMGGFGLERDKNNNPEEWVFNHSLATVALSDLLILSRDRFNLSASVSRGTELCLGWQDPDSGWRWWRQGNNVSVTCALALALEAARDCSRQRLTTIVKDRFAEPFNRAAAEWTTSEADALDFFLGHTSRVGIEAPLTATLLRRLFAEMPSDGHSLRHGVEVLVELPSQRVHDNVQPSTFDLFCGYVATRALSQIEGESWKLWSDAVKQTLLRSQRQGGVDAGSWDPIAGEGRACATALRAAMLAVRSRHPRSGDPEGER